MNKEQIKANFKQELQELLDKYDAQLVAEADGDIIVEFVERDGTVTDELNLGCKVTS